MKQKTLWISALVLWILIFSTAFSLWVERVTVPWVTVTEARRTLDSIQESVPLDCLAEDEEGNPALYLTYEGWDGEEGTRASLMSPQSYSIAPDRINVEFGGHPIIRYFSKRPQDGKPVNILLDPREGPDTLLILCPDGLPPVKENMPDGYRVVGQSGTALLVSAEHSSFPFLPKKADSDLFEGGLFDEPKRQVYSLEEFQTFTGALRLLAVVPGLGLLVFLLWLYSCFLLKNARENRTALLINGSIAVLSLLFIPVILSRAELPSSLLPPNNIVDFSYYVSEFREVFAGLEGFAAAGDQTAAGTLQSAVQSLVCSLWVLLGGGALAAVAIIVETVFRKKRRVQMHASHRR